MARRLPTDALPAMATTAPPPWLRLERRVRFGDTDAAGVMHFHQLLRWCHEAWEESLERYGIAASTVFPGAAMAAMAPRPTPEALTDGNRDRNGDGDSNRASVGAADQGPITPPPRPGADPAAVALPIVHCSADYRRPLVCGDRLLILLEPRRLDPMAFEVIYRFQRDGSEEVARGLIRHLAISSGSRRRCPLPEPIQRWLEASALGGGIQPL
jgi:1,4-dihydroxy-2-naphthoyl-CoA hydrolase